MTLDHLRIYSRPEVDQMIAEHVSVYKEGVLLGLIAAAASGALVGVGILLAVQKVFS